MRIKQIGSNQTVLEMNRGERILYSYETPVAGWSPLIGWFKDSKKYSVTTTKHVNKFLEGNEAELMTSEEIENMFILDYTVGGVK